MGAYTTVTASEFNGFPKAQRIYEADGQQATENPQLK
jgi:hypothetical protein